jgi:hypothetical protein
MQLPFRNEGVKSFFVMLEPEGDCIEVEPGAVVELRLVPEPGEQSLEIEEDADVLRIYSLSEKEIWKSGSRVWRSADRDGAYGCRS